MTKTLNTRLSVAALPRGWIKRGAGVDFDGGIKYIYFNEETGESTGKRPEQTGTPTSDLINAISTGDTDAARKALTQGADPNALVYQCGYKIEMPMLHAALFHFQFKLDRVLDMVKLLLHNGANILGATLESPSCLYQAMQLRRNPQESLAVIRLLLTTAKEQSKLGQLLELRAQNGARFARFGESIFHVMAGACSKVSVGALRMILKEFDAAVACNVDLVDAASSAPVFKDVGSDLAIPISKTIVSYLPVPARLIDAQSPATPDKGPGPTPLMKVAGCGRPTEAIATAKLLLEAQANPFLTGTDGYWTKEPKTALGWARFYAELPSTNPKVHRIRSRADAERHAKHNKYFEYLKAAVYLIALDYTIRNPLS